MLPQTPIPVQTAQPMLPRNMVRRVRAHANAMYQARGGRSTSAMRETLSVMRAKALSPAGALTKGFTSLMAAISAELRVRVADAAEVTRARSIVHVVEQAVRAGGAVRRGHLRGLIVQVAEDDGVGGARVLARRRDRAVGDARLHV